MKQDIEDGKINLVITKDLSRLGRDYIETGYYLEKYFPAKRVRYISFSRSFLAFLFTISSGVSIPSLQKIKSGFLGYSASVFTPITSFP